MAITDFFAPSAEYVSQMEDIQETYRVSTDNLTAIFTRSFVRVQIYKNESSQYGWNSRKMVYSSEGVPLEEFNRDFIIDQLNHVFGDRLNASNSFLDDRHYRQVDDLMKLAVVELIRNNK